MPLRAAQCYGVAGNQTEARPQQPADVTLLLEVVRVLVAEVRPSGAMAPVRLDSRFAEDLGLDSLALVELRSRVEDCFGAVLPDSVLAAGTVREWLDAARAAGGRVRLQGRLAPGPTQAPVASEAAGLPAGAETLLDALAWQVAAHRDRTHICLLNFTRDEPPQQQISYGDLAAGAQAVADGLRARGLRPGERVAIMLPTCPEYFMAFMGTVMAGGVAVPLYPPAKLAGLEDHLRRQAGILSNALADLLVAFPEVLRVARLLQAQVPSLRIVTTVSELHGTGAGGALPKVTADDTAMLQYTSGSTGDPKGVILTHRHLLANIRAMGAAADAGPSDVFVSWLPLYHDMGLIGAWLAGLCLGFQLVLMSPLAFLARPARWLRAISEHRGTLSGAPNFAYELCVRRVSDQELQGLDLSSWRLAFDGSEAVSPATLHRFSQRFGQCGLRPEAMAPAYGLAEAGVAVTFPPLGRSPAIDIIDRATLTRGRQAVPAAATDATALEVVSCGRPLPGYQLRVVDSAGRQLPERHEGRIEFTGPSLTPGYYRNEAATRQLRHGIWADTGDLGYLAGGQLYLTGRAKDIIIRGGRNLHPDELEAAAGRLSGVEEAGVAVFGCPDPRRGTERLIVVAETRLRDAEERAELRRAITALSADLLGGPPNEVVLAAPGTVPKTASGKIRRAATRDRYQAGTLGRPARGARWQVARFAASGLRPRLQAAGRSAAALLYAGYAWAATVIVAIPTWLLVAALPGRRGRWAVVRAAGRLLRALLAVPLTVTGAAPTAGPFVAVANHASFADGLILALCLPEPICFAAAGRFATGWLTGPFLRRIGCVFVHRAEPVKAPAESRRLADVLRSGRSLAVWPEGGLDPAPGLRPFHLGAFDAAVSAGTPVVPVGIRGSHDMLRPGTRLPRRYAIHVAIGAPIKPASTGWPAILALRDQARAAVLALSREPDLG
jgi:acyl carrier protein